MAEKLRKKGQTNEQIADALGVSPRTVSRYLSPAVKTKMSLVNTIRALPAEEWIRLFKLLKYDSSNQETGIWLFLLRYLDHPQWEMFWSHVTVKELLQAIAIRRHFETLKMECNCEYGRYWDLMVACHEEEDFEKIKALWDEQGTFSEDPF
jgi:hypothetical protein